MKVIIVGAGFGGLCAAVQIEKQLGISDYVLFEANEDVGGTWNSNSYPGAACDIPSHSYSLSFEPNSEWQHHYSYQPEILKYLQHVAEKYDVNRRIRFSTHVESTIWNEETHLWEVIATDKKTGQQTTYTANVVIAGCGPLRVAKSPKEFEAFKGEKMHTAKWDKNIELEGRNVVIVGSGASAVQAIPEVAKVAKHLTVYLRTPPWVFPRFNFAHPEWMKSAFRNVPGARAAWRNTIWCLNEARILLMQKNWIATKVGAAAEWGADLLMKYYVKDPVLRKKLTPSYSLGCKRILVTDDFHASLARENVTVITDPILKVEKDAIVSKDNNVKPDVVILATGFATDAWWNPMKVVGKGNVDLMEKWVADGMGPLDTYMGISVNGYPNFFHLLGPNTILGHNSVVFMIECQVTTIVHAIRDLMQTGAASIEPKKEVARALTQQLHDEIKNTVWVSGCNSWYGNANGDIYALWSGDSISYWNRTRSWNTEQWDHTYVSGA